MNVLQLGPYPPPNGGVAANISAIRAALLSSGHSCAVVALTRPANDVPQEGIHRPRTAWQVVKTLRATPCDIVHLHIGGDLTWRLLGLAFACTVLPRRKAVLTFHSGGYPASAKGKRGGRWSLRGFVFRRFENVICVNREIADMFMRFGLPERKVRLISPFSFSPPAPGTIVPETIVRFIESHRPILISVGLLEPEYDLLEQIDVLEAVRQVHASAGLVLIGSGSLESELRSLIESKPYADHILLCGDVPHDATLKVIGQCDLMLRTTLYDGDAISVREALHLGRPVVATDAAPRPPGVDVVPGRNRKALKVAILRNLAPGARRPTAGADGQSNIRAVISLYAELL